MLIYGVAEIRRLEKSLQDSEDGDVYAKLQSKLSNYFSPKKNGHYARYLFLKMKPHAGEGTVSYAALLRENPRAVNSMMTTREYWSILSKQLTIQILYAEY